jgi:hypothetical protein
LIRIRGLPMIRSWERAVPAVLVVVLLIPLCLGCGGGGRGGVTITIGEMTDLTGAASPALIPIHYGLVDLMRYYNEESLIPGVKLKVETWDTHMDPARTLPGYDWLRGRGADLIISIMPQDAVIMKPFADRDKFPVFSNTSLPEMWTPPGWVFCLSNRNDQLMVTLLKWVSEKHWDYSKGIPRIGFIGWSEVNSIGIEKAMREYCQGHPDKFEYVHGFLAPVGTMTFGGEIERLKDCNYIGINGYTAAPFIEEYQSRGYSATFLDPASNIAQYGLFVDRLGWEALDGTLTATWCQTWTEPSPILDLAKELLHKYRPNQADAIMHEGTGYVDAGVEEIVPMLAILQNATAQVGAEDLSSQAIYDAAVKYKTGGPLWQGFPQWGFSETKRYLSDHARIYEWSAAKKDFVRSEDWVPLVTEW